MIDREWVVREHYSDLLIGENVDGGYLIATLHTGYCHPSFVEKQRKNARLIAAAPELLDALRDIIEWFDAGDVEAARECAGRARAAIEKATGQ